ncbi:MAG: PQQ-binding-like beta-propeller repeat protein [Proteobacteria bacterium]|nr:PQQ-binding-like beta-propeller repeat protein [Pseudomonadota bacterium]
MGGQIGTGTVFTEYDLAPGTHTITLTATNSQGESDAKSVTITVKEKPAGGAIHVEIESPEDGDVFEYKKPLTFSGSAVDDQEGKLKGTSLVWKSSLDGDIGTGETFTTSDLSGGTHRITLTATNSRHVRDFASVTITVVDRRLWQYQYKLSDAVAFSSSPAVAGESVFASSSDGTVFSFDAATGKTLWTVEPPSIPLGIAVVGAGASSPVIVDDYLYIGCYGFNSSDTTAPGILLCLKHQSGQKVWQFLADLPIDSSPAVSQGNVYVGDVGGKMYCVNAQNGSKVWEFATDDTITGTPAVAEGFVYFGSADKKVYCLDAQSGDKQWEFETGDSIYSSPAVAGGKVFIGSSDKKLYCLTSDGKLVWDFKAKDVITTAPAIAGDTLYVGTGDGTVYAVKTNTGNEFWEFKAGAGISSSPAIAGQYLYIGSDDKKLYCLNNFTGEKLWEFETGGAVSSSPAISNNLLYVGGSDSTFYCFKADESKNAAWPMFKFNPERTGAQQ